MSRPDWLLTVIKLTFPKDFERIRPLINLGPVAQMVERALFEGDHMVCLPRDRTVTIGESIDAGTDQVVLPSALCDYLIDRMNYHVVMDFCVCRRSCECKDYPVGLGCLFMGEAARGINPDWGRQISAEAAKAHIRTCQEAGLIHFVGKSKLDTVWLGIGPGNQLLTICSCCPCCCITRGLAVYPDTLASKIHRAPGVEVTVTDDCAACGTCGDGVCFADAISLDGDRAAISADCRGCGRCAESCPESAIHLEIDGDRFISETCAGIAEVIDLDR